MLEQNGGKFRRLEKIIKKSLLVGIKNFSENVIALCVDSDEKIKKIVMATLNLQKEQEK